MKKSREIREITPEKFAKLKHAIQRKVGLLWGYRECVNGKMVYYMFPEHFEAFFAKDFELPRVLKVLLKQGILLPNENNNHLHTKVIDGREQSFYVLKQDQSGTARK
jgi:hypothetical protein